MELIDIGTHTEKERSILVGIMKNSTQKINRTLDHGSIRIREIPGTPAFTGSGFSASKNELADSQSYKIAASVTAPNAWVCPTDSPHGKTPKVLSALLRTESGETWQRKSISAVILRRA
jgi:hypothetical protein